MLAPDATTTPPEPAWAWASSIDVRQGDHPPVPAPIPGLLEGRVTLLAGAGGSGKTTMTEQIIRHLCSGRQLGRFELPDSLMVGWCIFLEDTAAMAQDRSLRAAPFGSLWEDSQSDDPGASSVRYLFGRDFRLSDLRRELARARDDDVLPGIVVIDHLRILIGSQPAGTSPNDWERRNLLQLIDIADEYQLHFVVLTHLNKEGKVSGTTELINSVDTAYVIKQSADNPKYATLECRKMRMSPETDFPLLKLRNGTWSFTDQVLTSEVVALGIAQDIIAVLKREGPRTLSELVCHGYVSGERAGVRAALDRARRRGWVRTYRGHWILTPSEGDQLMQPPDTPADNRAPQSPSAQVTMPAQRDTPPATEPIWDPAPEPEDVPGFRGLEVLKASIRRSRMHPLPAIELADRDQLPWTLFTERMGGAPRWNAAQIPLGGKVVTIDRNGSFPSACSSVPLAPNKLLHTGPQERYDSSLAGIYQIRVPEWPDTFPHPLGRLAGAPGELVWITTPHMRQLEKLADSHLLRRPAILDSWLGRSNGSLFEHFYKEARAARMELAEAGGDPYIAYKRSVSIALRLLWPKSSRSPFWRPDWRVSMVAEASVRHWEAARKAVDAGAVLIAMGNTDAATYWTPDGTVPEPYVIGPKFGQVKVATNPVGA